MRRAWRVTLVVLILVLCSSPDYAQSEATEAAKSAAESWLGLVDAGKYAESWEEAAAFFKSKVSKKQWEGALQSARAPLGKVQSRTLKGAQYSKELPGAPQGEYVVIQYETSYENKQSAVETITPMREQDGAWRVSGYFIK